MAIFEDENSLHGDAMQFLVTAELVGKVARPNDALGTIRDDVL